jgi:membrane protein YdbS with pleckstrin-like domain
VENAAPTPEPTQRLPPEARGYFVIGSLLWTVPLLVAGLAGTAALDGAGLAGWATWSLRVLVVTIAVAGSAVFPLIRWRTWRYEVRSEELDLLRGALVVTRTLIPMARVQHVDTERNPLADLFDLRSVTVHTAAGSHDIPALRPGEAIAIRDRLAQLARMPDDV